MYLTDFSETDTGQNTTKGESAPAASTPVGAIAGGVAGGVAVIAIVAGALVWYFRRRQKRNMNNGSQELEGSGNASRGDSSSSAPEVVAWKAEWKQHVPRVYHEMSTNGPALEMGTNMPASEMDSGYSIPQAHVSAVSRPPPPVELQGNYYQ